VVLRGSAGARLGVALPGPTFGSPSFGAGAGVLVGPWEVSAFGTVDPAYALAPPLAGFTMLRFAVGVAIGRRAGLGPVFVDFGVSAMGAISYPDGGNGSSSESTVQLNSPGDPEPLMGLYAGFAYPRRSPLRLRTELSTDLVIYRSVLARQSQPQLPQWSTTASVGAEWEVP
ncbi:MAG: hypothetical protein M3O36_14285, partial [Myxococcota bacterium]|nr:hypothetical protein [Myxococcota bacterium]